MQWLTYVLPIVLMVAFGFFALSRMRTMKASMEPGMRTFLERTGFRLEGAADDSVEASVQAWTAGYRAQQSQGRYEVHMRRDFRGLPIVHQQFMGHVGKAKDEYVMSAWWRAEVPRPRVLFHLADRSLGSVGSAVKGALTSTKRHFEPRYRSEVKSGDAAFDKRFQIWAENEAMVQPVLQQMKLRAALAACAEVDLLVTPDGITFNDPEQKNIRSAMGGTLSAMAMGGDMGKMIELSIGVHDKICEALATVHEATRG